MNKQIYVAVGAGRWRRRETQARGQGPGRERMAEEEGAAQGRWPWLWWYRWQRRGDGVRRLFRRPIDFRYELPNQNHKYYSLELCQHIGAGARGGGGGER